MKRHYFFLAASLLLISCGSKQGEALSAIFFTTAGLAQIRYDGVDYLLRQYVTASGYGYKNPFVDIRGKGQDMTLTFSVEGKSIAFTEKK